MIDIENQVYTTIATALRTEYPNINVTSEPVMSPASFPCVAVFEADNYSYTKTEDSGSNENHVRVMFEAHVYSNKKSGRKTECKTIFNLIDDKFLSMGFARTSKTPVPDNEIYRIVGRYEAVVSKNKTIFRR